jgi:hypothetical protein
MADESTPIPLSFPWFLQILDRDQGAEAMPPTMEVMGPLLQSRACWLLGNYPVDHSPLPVATSP